MTLWKLILASLRHDRATVITTLLGVAVATAVIVGSLIVGDSVSRSLRDLALDRIGSVNGDVDGGVDTVVTATRFFTPPITLNNTGAIILPAAVETEHGRAGAVDLIALPSITVGAVVSQSLAEKLSLNVGDELRLRVPLPSPIPRDAALGEKSETLIRAPISVAAIGTEQFTLRLGQQTPLTVYVPLAWLQDRLGGEIVARRQVNTLLLASEGTKIWQSLREEKTPEIVFTASDIGLTVTTHQNTANQNTVFIASQQLLFSQQQVAAIRSVLSSVPNTGDVREALVHLAESIQINEHVVPYATLAAIDGEEIGDNEIVLNAWTADQLAATPGDFIELTFFEPDSLHGEVTTQRAVLRLTRIEPMRGLYAEPRLVPDIPGVTDEASLADWNPPFPFDAKRLRRDDEDYWDEHRAAPKAFVSLATGRRLWKSRFGETTTLVVGGSLEPFTHQDIFATAVWRRDPEAFGFVTLPLRARVLAASAGTTPFGILFLALSMFLIAAAVLLSSLLFRLLGERRQRELRLLAAIGWTPHQLRKRLLYEGAVMAVTGGVVGTLLGIAYAQLMICGLATIWRDAIVVPFVQLHVVPLSVIIGGLGGIAVALVTLWSSLTVRHSRVEPALAKAWGGNPKLTLRVLRATTSPIPVIALGVGLLLWGQETKDELGRAAVFFASGAAALALALIFVWRRMIEHASSDEPTRLTLTRLAMLEAWRHPARTLTCVALMASAAFVVLAMEAFRWTGSGDLTQRDSGSGGFSLIVEARLPIFGNLNDTASRKTLGITAAEEAVWNGAKTNVFACRVRDGDDASCQNLYRSTSPRLIGLPTKFISRGGFKFSGHSESQPWHSLLAPATKNSSSVWRVPVILEESTAIYALHLAGVGSVFSYQDKSGQPVECEVVALLSGSLFQGDMLISEENLLTLFPDVSGERFFAVETSGDIAGVSRIFQRLFSDLGEVDETPRERLARFFSVQNSYLSVFQSLGGLGLLLGVAGLAVVEFRSVVSRRRVLTLLKAIGFSDARVMALVLLEVAVLTAAASLVAVIAAAIATAPHLLRDGSGIAAFVQAAAITLGAMTLVAVVSSLAAAHATRRFSLESLFHETD